jgi:hypothetical protein
MGGANGWIVLSTIDYQYPMAYIHTNRTDSFNGILDMPKLSGTRYSMKRSKPGNVQEKTQGRGDEVLRLRFCAWMDRSILCLLGID